MRKIIITEEDKRNILKSHYGDNNPKLFDYLISTFKVSSDLLAHNMGFGERLVFNGEITDVDGEKYSESFLYVNNKKKLKYDIINFIQNDPKVFEILQIKPIVMLLDLIRKTDDENEKDEYKNELKNQLDIYHRDSMYRRNIEAKLNKTVKDFIDFLTSN